MPNKRRALVTGGTGLVGTAIARFLMQGGWQVTVASRRPPERRIGADVQWLPLDLRYGAAEALRAAAGTDACVHCAGDINDANDCDSIQRLIQVNGLATRELLAWCSHSGVNRFVLISSLSVLRKPLRNPVLESDAVGPSTVYGMSKLLAEEAVVRHSSVQGLQCVILRISSPIPEMLCDLPPTVVRKWVTAARENRAMIVHGSGSRSQDFVSCDDIAAAAEAAMTSTCACGIYNIGSGSTLTMLELAKLLKDRVGGTIEFCGLDPNEDDRCVLSIVRACEDLQYEPRLTGWQAIERLLW